MFKNCLLRDVMSIICRNFHSRLVLLLRRKVLKKNTHTNKRERKSEIKKKKKSCQYCIRFKFLKVDYSNRLIFDIN